MEDSVKERPDKCSAYDNKLFTKGRQDSHQDAIATLANLVVFFEFIIDETQSSETPSLVMMLRNIGRLLVTPTFRNFAERYKKTIPWLAHTIICH